MCAEEGTVDGRGGDVDNRTHFQGRGPRRRSSVKQFPTIIHHFYGSFGDLKPNEMSIATTIIMHFTHMFLYGTTVNC